MPKPQPKTPAVFPKTPADVLNRAANLIERHGLATKCLRDYRGGLCVGGAIAQVVGGDAAWCNLLRPEATITVRAFANLVASDILNKIKVEDFIIRDEVNREDEKCRVAMYRWSDSFWSESELESGRQVALKLRIVAQHPSLKFTPLNRGNRRVVFSDG